MAHDEVRAAAADDRGHVIRLVFGNLAARALHAAVELRIVELIGDGQRSAADLAARAGTDPQSTLRLLRALTALGLLREPVPGTFSATPAGALLDPGAPGSMAALVLSSATMEQMMRPGWDYLADSVRTGDTSFEKVFDKDFFSHLRDHPERSARFNEAMSQATRSTAAVLPGSFDFGRFGTVADVGGGDGTLLAAVLREHTSLTGILHDTEEGLAQAPETLRRDGLADRCSLVPGDFFTSVPEGADVYLVKSILHDWPDDRCATILGHCREVLPAGGRVLIVEPVLAEAVDPGAVGLYLGDLNMLVNWGGRERTRTEFDAVCHRAGLEIVSVTPLAGPGFSLIEARAV
ncbi:putative O-methyltransferase [Actinacidiphila reveromycinica]|uniref:Putative O-methyltransferase n=1 Tax=Actinacidiphila reveromycinica TaxID=659352 RepID=A0A7U3URE2_9ACTN|nr:methyltransferase [Streptomyces sp. SN-593]BBA97266.1 putative O-methyltransferase [Streptomyces sp. SN-593]